MLYYRFYLEDSGGRIVRAEEATLIDDAAAMAQAEQISHPHNVSVWQQNRRVAEVTPAHRAL